jgi:ATP-binding cassette subfamily C protein LapB
MTVAAARAPQAAAADDPLLECLALVMRLNGRPMSPAAIIAGLPVERARLSASEAIRAAERQGYAARVAKRSLARISSLTLPAILLLHGERALVLQRFESADTLHVLFPETGARPVAVTASEIDTEYTGYCLFLQPRADRVADDAAEAAPNSWFWGTLWRFKRFYAETIVAAALINILALASSLFTMNVYDRVVPNNAIPTLWVLAIGTSLAMAFEFLLRVLRGYLLDHAGKKADLLLASRLFEQALAIKMEARPSSAGAFASNVREFESVRDFMTSATLTAFTDLPFSLLFVVVVWLIAGPIAWIPLIAIPIVLGAGLIAQLPLSRLLRSHLKESAAKHGVLIESVEGAETLKSMSAEGRMQGKWDHYSAVTARTAMTSRLISAVMLNFSLAVQQIATVAAVVWGVYLIAAGALSMGALVASVILIGRALSSLSQLAGLLARYQHARNALRGLNEIMRLPIERPPNKTFLHQPAISGAIEVDKLRFAYPRQKRFVLDGVSLQFGAGERIAVLGRVGSGKSTLLKLLAGMYEPSEGRVFAGGVDLRQIDPADVRRAVTYVSQEVRLFQGSLKENLALANPLAEDDELFRAAQLAGIDRWAAGHPLGFDLLVGERGENLSGGQKQAVAIARGFLSNAAVVLLDEPTSSMDHNTEASLITNLKSYLTGRSLVIATHKPALLELVDRVIVLDAGRIVLDGARDSVLRELSRGA